MARYGHLKVFKDSYELTKCSLASIRKFPKMFKYTLGSEIQNNMYAILNSIIVANSKIDKSENIREAITKLEIVQIQMRLAKDMQCFSNTNIWFDLTEKSNIILRQLEGWIKHQKVDKEVSD